jgi:multisubunit Na+/H+ antiporter MnhF subunit
VVNGWLVAAAVGMAGLGVAVYGVATGGVRRRLRAQNAATLLASLVMLLLSQGFGRPSYVDLTLMLAVLGPVGTLVYVRLMTDAAGGARGQALTVAGTVAAVAVVVPVCAVTPPGRALAKLVVIGVLLVAGWLVSSRAVGGV